MSRARTGAAVRVDSGREAGAFRKGFWSRKQRVWLVLAHDEAHTLPDNGKCVRAHACAVARARSRCFTLARTRMRWPLFRRCCFPHVRSGHSVRIAWSLYLDVRPDMLLQSLFVGLMRGLGAMRRAYACKRER
eukprot:346815-Pleurochrysis_carterae.AAC.4